MTSSWRAAAPRGLRERQSDLTRRVVFEALSGLLAEGTGEFSVQDVADRAGVSHRTVYRHFASREALMSAYMDWLELQIAQAGGLSLPATDADIAEAVRREHEVLDSFRPALVGVMRLGVASERGAARRIERTRAIRAAVGDLITDLDPSRAEAVFWVIRCLTSSATWTFMREEGGINGRRSGEAVGWAIDTLLDALRRGAGPGAPGHGRSAGDGTLQGGVSDGGEQAPGDGHRARRAPDN